MTKPVLSIVVPVVDHSDLTIKCFVSIRERTVLPFEIIWVDNGSQQAEYDIIERQAKFPKTNCRVIRNSENLGFIKATNQGIREARGDYVILLNNDTEVTKGWDTQLVKPLMHFGGIGVVGPVASASAWQTPHGIQTSLGIPFPKHEVPKTLEMYKDKYVILEKIALSFFCAAFRTSTFRDLGGLCEDLSIGLGDDDEYCARLRANGYKVALALGAYVKHVHHATFTSLNLGMVSLRRYNLKILKNRLRQPVP